MEEGRGWMMAPVCEGRTSHGLCGGVKEEDSAAEAEPSTTRHSRRGGASH